MNTNTSNKRGVAQGLSSGILWGLYTALIGTLGTTSLLSGYTDKFSSPIIIASVGAILSAVLSIVYIIYKGYSREFVRVVFSRHALPILLSAVLAGPLAMTAYTASTSMSGASLSSAVSALYPVIGLLICVSMKKEPMTKLKFIGVVTATLGTCMIGYIPGDSSAHIVGLSLAVIAAIGWASEGVLSSSVMEEVRPDVAICLRQVFSMVVYTLVIIPMLPNTSQVYTSVNSILSSHDLLPLLALVGLSSTASYLLWYRSLNVLKVSTAMVLNVSYTLWTIVFDIFINKSSLTWIFVIGSVVLTAGTMIVVSQDNP